MTQTGAQILKRELLAAADVFARAGLVVLATAVGGVPTLLFDVVASRGAGLTAFGVLTLLLVVCWWVT